MTQARNIFDTEVKSLSVSPPRLLRETEEAEEDNRAHRYHPSRELHGYGTLMIGLPKDRGIKIDSGIVKMRVGPADPRLDGTVGDGQIHSICANGDSDE